MTEEEIKKMVDKYKTRYYDTEGKPLTLMQWADYIEDRKFNRHIADEEINGYRISTVWMGLDHSFGGGQPPLIFETMIFEAGAKMSDPYDQNKFYDYQERYCTKEEALEGHKLACDLVREQTK